MTSKWSKAYFADLVERVGSVLIYGLITWFTLAGTTPLDVGQLWPAVVLPAVLSLLKGLVANMANPESGASVLSTPPGPVIEDDYGMGGL